MILPKDALPVEYCVVFSSSWLLPVWRAREHKGGSRLKPQSSFQIVSAHLQQRHCRASQHTRALDTAERHSTRGRQTPQSVTAHEGARHRRASQHTRALWRQQLSPAHGARRAAVQQTPPAQPRDKNTQQPSAENSGCRHWARRGVLPGLARRGQV